MEDNLNVSKIEDNINFLKMEDNLNVFQKLKTTSIFWEREDKLNFGENGRRSKYFPLSNKLQD